MREGHSDGQTFGRALSKDGRRSAGEDVELTDRCKVEAAEGVCEGGQACVERVARGVMGEDRDEPRLDDRYLALTAALLVELTPNPRRDGELPRLYLA